MEIWRAASLPAQLTDEPAEEGDPIIGPPASGLSVRIAVFPPDRDIDERDAAAYEAAMDELYGDQADPTPAAVPGMHRTDTVDIVTVLDGELTIILEDGETLLRTGDCLVQRGTRHAGAIDRTARAPCPPPC